MQRILLAYDGGEPARRAMATAAELAKKFEATVTVVSVVPVHPGRTPIDPWDDGLVHAQELKEAGEALRELGIEPELLEPSGDPATVIERVAEQINADVVVVGSRGLSAVGRVLQGSVSQHVATHAATTVIVAR
jgi:nucleotide-binding universal stress UspA family protein